MELDDDSYEYYTESTSESQGHAQQSEPDKQARAAYMIAGCIILLLTWCAVVWTKRPDGMGDVLYCLAQVFSSISWSATQQSRHVRELCIWIQRAIKGAYKLAVQQTATGTYLGELLTSLQILNAVLYCILWQVQRWLVGHLHHRPDESRRKLPWAHLRIPFSVYLILFGCANFLDREDIHDMRTGAGEPAAGLRASTEVRVASINNTSRANMTSGAVREAAAV